MIPAKALTVDGYIINQSLLSSINYGKFTSDYNGCSWIAAFNLLKLCGIEIDPLFVADMLSEKLCLGGKFGMLPTQLPGLLERLGLSCNIKIGNHTLPEKGILWYLHSNGAHYTAFLRVQADKYHIYNDMYGTQNDIRSKENFLKGKHIFAVIEPK